MNKPQSLLKICAWVSLGALFALFILSILFFKERLLFADTAFTAFEQLNSESLLLLGHRYGAVTTKLLPYLLLHLHVPVIPVLMSYLLSYNLFYFGVVGILFFAYKDYKMGILMVISYLLIVSYSSKNFLNPQKKYLKNYG